MTARGAIAVLALVVCARTADAHLNSTGLGPVYDGILHFLLSPEDVLAVLALALWSGLRGAAYGRRASFLLPGAWLVAGVLGSTAPATTGNAAVSATWLVLLGGLLAADAKLPLRAAAVLCGLVGAWHGYMNGTGMGFFGWGTAALLGLGLAVFVVVALAAAFVVWLRAAWARIAVRVAGSWIAASGLLLLGWAAGRH